MIYRKGKAYGRRFGIVLCLLLAAAAWFCPVSFAAGDGSGGGAGAVVGFFSCGAYEATNAFTLHDFKGKEELRRSFITRSCLTEDELVAYAQDSAIYGWRVNMVVRFPKPRPLSDFGLTRAPQSWQYLK